MQLYCTGQLHQDEDDSVSMYSEGIPQDRNTDVAASPTGTEINTEGLLWGCNEMWKCRPSLLQYSYCCASSGKKESISNSSEFHSHDKV